MRGSLHDKLVMTGEVSICRHKRMEAALPISAFRLSVNIINQHPHYSLHLRIYDIIFSGDKLSLWNEEAICVLAVFWVYHTKLTPYPFPSGEADL